MAEMSASTSLVKGGFTTSIGHHQRLKPVKPQLVVQPLIAFTNPRKPTRRGLILNRLGPDLGKRALGELGEELQSMAPSPSIHLE